MQENCANKIRQRNLKNGSNRNNIVWISCISPFVYPLSNNIVSISWSVIVALTINSHENFYYENKAFTKINTSLRVLWEAFSYVLIRPDSRPFSEPVKLYQTNQRKKSQCSLPHLRKKKEKLVSMKYFSLFYIYLFIEKRTKSEKNNIVNSADYFTGVWLTIT